MVHWASRLKKLGIPEFYITDRDNKPPKKARYAKDIKKINEHKNCQAVATEKREMENYLHPKAIEEAYDQNGIKIVLKEQFDDFDNVPELVSIAIPNENDGDPPSDNDARKQRKKESDCKKLLNNHAVKKMNVERLLETDPNNEIIGWLNKISKMTS